ncbi:MAG: helix-turn-helix domain-containing protein [Treponema sp.]|nr:helix-turn-helix domain-containing protein [Treponema sp.]
MEQYLIGDIIRETRIRLGIPQEDLCIGDLDITTISRIENGEHIPQYSIIKKIFAQMNMRLPINIIRVNDEEFNRYVLQEKIEENLENEDVDIKSLAEDFKNLNIAMDEFDNQLYYLVQGILKKRESNFNYAKNLFYKALTMTLPDYSENFEFSKRRFLHKNEIQCIYELANTEFIAGNKDISEKHLLIILNYLEHSSISEKESSYLKPKIVFALCKLNDDYNSSQKLLHYSKIGIDFCIKQKLLCHLSDFFYFNSRALSYQGKVEEAKTPLNISLIILENMKKANELNEKQKTMKQDFNLDTKW